MRRDLEMHRGTTLTHSVTAKKDGGAAIDLTGLTGSGVRWRLTDWDKLETKVTKTIGSGVTVTDASNGKFTVTLDPGDTINLEPDYYRHEGEVTEGSGAITTVTRGVLEIRRDAP